MRLHAALLIFLLHFCDARSKNNTKNTGDILKECKTVYDQLKRFVNWPIYINCSFVTEQGVPLESTQCTSQIQIQEVSKKRVKAQEIIHFSFMKLNYEGICLKKNFTVETFANSSRPWIDDVNADVSRRNYVINVSVPFLNFTTLPCRPPDDSSSIERVTFPPDFSYTSIWRLSTRDVRTNSAALVRTPLASRDAPLKEIVAPGEYPSPYYLAKATYYRPGTYSCEIRARRKRVYVVHYSLCVQEKHENIVPIVNCQTETDFERETNSIVTCSVIVSNGVVEPKQLELVWSKKTRNRKQNTICSIINKKSQGSENSLAENRISCGWKDLKQIPLKCVDHFVHDGDTISPELLKFKIYLNLTNAMQSDEGFYIGRLRYYDLWSKGFEIKLTYNREQDLRLVAMRLFVAFGSIVFVLLIGLLLWCNKTKFLLFKRRHFGTFDKDDKEYVATLYYHIDSVMAEKDLEYTRVIVNLAKETLTNLNYNYLDQQEKFQPGNFPEMMLANITHSQTFILILTESFSDDNNSMFVANQGYLSMLQNQTKLIIISAPGAVKSIKQSNHKYSKQVLKALKGSDVIKWKASMKEARFRDELEYALPNLDRSKIKKSANQIDINSSKI